MQAAGIPAKTARGLGIAVDARRRNRCVESLQANAARLKAYRANLLVFPRKAGKPKAGEASKEEAAAAVQLKGALMPVAKAAPVVEYGKVTPEMTVRPVSRQRDLIRNTQL